MPLLRPAVKDDDNYLAKIIKYIPGEILAAYTAIIGVLKNPTNTRLPTQGNVSTYFFILVLITLLTPVWTYFAVKDNPNVKEPPSKTKRAVFHSVIATVAFLIWVYASGDILFKSWLCKCYDPSTLDCFREKGHDIYNSALGAIVLIIFTGLLVPLLERIFLGKPVSPLKLNLNKKKAFSSIDDNIGKWSKLTDCYIRFDVSSSAIGWVKNNGNFSTNPQKPKDFVTAMSIDVASNLQAAFSSSIIIGIICQESSFGTLFDNSTNYKGPYQLAQIVADDFNNNNSSNTVSFPDDIDELSDLSIAARVASWFYANNLQKLTKSSEYVNPIKDITEAIKFAVASYNGGPTLIKNAREITNEPTGGEREIWDKVKVNLEAAGVTTEKANEIRNYVESVLAYAAKSDSCWCASC